MFEALVDSGTLIGHVSQSGQWAPYNYAYEWFNTTCVGSFILRSLKLNRLSFAGITTSCTAIIAS
jgi:Ni,Fe-hydrogenase I cytochrome b subunit